MQYAWLMASSWLWLLAARAHMGVDEEARGGEDWLAGGCARGWWWGGVALLLLGMSGER
jgi:hypothetical protein